MTQYRYHSDKPEHPHGYLRQEPMMDKPMEKNFWLPPGDGDAGPFFAQDSFNEAMNDYNSHIQSLPTIICSAGKWEERVYPEDEVVIGYQYANGKWEWLDCEKHDYDNCTPHLHRLVASLKQKGEEKKPDWWKPKPANAQCKECSIDEPYEQEIMKGGVLCGGCGRLRPNVKYVLATPTASGERMMSDEDFKELQFIRSLFYKESPITVRLDNLIDKLINH